MSPGIPVREHGYEEWFVQEIRRFYPFFPAAVGKVARTFVWKGYRLRRGNRVLLDLYGTHHDERLWPSPQEFRPERFAANEPGLFNFIPQGGGRHAQTHRCPDEWITVALMKQAVRLMCDSITYDVPPQDLEIPMQEMPPVPRSKFVIKNVQDAQQGGEARTPSPSDRSAEEKVHDSEIVDEASRESFPASDPPAHTPVTSSGAREHPP